MVQQFDVISKFDKKEAKVEKSSLFTDQSGSKSKKLIVVVARIQN